MRRALHELAAGFAANDSAVAVVEFALIVPLMLMLYLGTNEAGDLISVDRRVQTVAGTVGDLVAREDPAIYAATLKDYFQAAENIMAPYPTDGYEERSDGLLVQTVSLVRVNADGETAVVWSRRFSGEAENHTPGHAAGAVYDLPEEITSLATDGYVVVSDASYSHIPLFGLVFKTAIPLYRENFYLPRSGKEICYNAPSC